MFRLGRLDSASPRARRWAFLGLAVLLLHPQPRPALAVDPAWGRPGDAPPVAAPQVQLDVALIRVKGGLARNFALHLLKGSVRVGADGRNSRAPYAGALDSPRDARDFLGFLQAMKEEGLAKEVAAPRLATLSGRPASFLEGGEQAVPIPAGLGRADVQFEEFGVRLNFLPTVQADGTIRLEAEPEVSTPTGEKGERTTQRLHTMTELKPGQTLLIGGLIQRPETAKGRPAPQPDELVVLVTPSLILQTPSPISEARPDQQPRRSTSKQDGPANEGSTREEAAERQRRLERRLNRLQEELADLRRELRSLAPNDPANDTP